MSSVRSFFRSAPIQYSASSMRKGHYPHPLPVSKSFLKRPAGIVTMVSMVGMFGTFLWKTARRSEETFWKRFTAHIKELGSIPSAIMLTARKQQKIKLGREDADVKEQMDNASHSLFSDENKHYDTLNDEEKAKFFDRYPELKPYARLCK
jgi:hypothetical protein